MTTQPQNPGTQNQNQKQKTGAGSTYESNRNAGREEERWNEQRGSQGASKSDADTDDEANRPQGADWQGHKGSEKSGSERDRGLSGGSNRSGDTQSR
jgi:hypothetical protein